MTMRYINRHYLCIYLSIYLFFKNTKQSKLAGNEDPHPELDQHQNLISSRGSSLTQPNESGRHPSPHCELSCGRTDGQTHRHTQ